MSCCKTNSTVTNHCQKMLCPNCEQACALVSLKTCLHQVLHPENQQLTDENYAFCSNIHCHVGYFSESHMIPKEKLRAFQKPYQPMLCYCFDISEQQFRKELEEERDGEIGDSPASKSLAFITAQTKEKRCACEIRNPSGRCCLAQFKQVRLEHAKNK